MGFFYIPILILFIFLVFQLTIKAKIFFNVKNNIGKLKVCFVGIKIFDYTLSIKSRCIKITNKKGKSKYLPIELDKESIKEYTHFQNILFRKIYFKRLGIFFNFGLKQNAFASAIVCGYVDILSKIAYTVFKTKKSETIMNLKVYPTFEKNVIKFGFKAKISLSIFDLLWSYAEAQTIKFLEGDNNAK